MASPSGSYSTVKPLEIEDIYQGNSQGNIDNNKNDMVISKPVVTKKTESDDKEIEFDNYEEKTDFASFSEYWSYRWQRSNLNKFYLGIGLAKDDVDSAVNALAVVDALILTIPFSLIGSLGSSYWEDYFYKLDLSCQKHGHDAVYIAIISCLYSTAYCSLISLIIAILYYFLRPSGKYFTQWWMRGRYALLFLFLGTVGSIVSMLVVFGMLMGNYVLPPNYCEQMEINNRRYGVSVGILGVVMIISLLLMF